MKFYQQVILFFMKNAFSIMSGVENFEKIHCRYVLKAILCSKKEGRTYNARGPLEL